MEPLKITHLLPHHAELVERWAKGWGEPAGKVDPSFWPTTALLVSSPLGQPLALGFLFLTNSKTAFIAGILGNPNCAKINRRAATKALIEALEAQARSLGYQICISTTASPGLKKTLIESGWLLHKESVGYFVKLG